MQSPHAEVESILSRFPGPITLYSSRRKWLRLLVICSLFAVAGMLMVLYRISGGWFFLIVFGVLSIMAVGMLLPGASSLELDEEGFRVTRFFRRRRSRWQDVKSFEAFVQRPDTDKVIVYDDIKSADTLLVRLNKALAHHNAFLPDTYGFPGEQLAWLMGQWRERATGRFKA